MTDYNNLELTSYPSLKADIEILSSTVLPIGTVVGVNHSDGKYKTSIKGATDGTQDPIGVLAEKVPKDKTLKVACYFSGALNKVKVIRDASWTSEHEFKSKLQMAGIHLVEFNPL